MPKDMNWNFKNLKKIMYIGSNIKEEWCLVAQHLLGIALWIYDIAKDFVVGIHDVL